MKTILGISDDYATMYTHGDRTWDVDESKISFYYGYEVTEGEDEEWMFVARENGVVLKSYSTSQIKEHVDSTPRDMSEYLLVGINMFINGA